MNYHRNASLALVASAMSTGSLAGYTRNIFSGGFWIPRSTILDTPENPQHAKARIAKAQSKRDRREARRACK